MKGSNEEDGAVVVGLWKAVLTVITTELPIVKKNSFNSQIMLGLIKTFPYYRNTFIEYSSQWQNIFVCQYVRVETQGGKTIVDSHFVNCR